jgi:hypothetical protein
LRRRAAEQMRVDDAPAGLHGLGVAQFVRGFQNGPDRIHRNFTRYGGVSIVDHGGAGLEFEQVAATLGQHLQIRDGAADGAASAAFNDCVG